MHGAEEQRMMAYQQIRSIRDGPVDHRHGRVSGEGDAPHVMAQVAHDQSRLIPLFGVS